MRNRGAKGARQLLKDGKTAAAARVLRAQGMRLEIIRRVAGLSRYQLTEVLAGRDPPGYSGVDLVQQHEQTRIEHVPDTEWSHDD